MARNIGLELARLDVCRACPGYQSTPLRDNCCCRKCGVDENDLPWQLINDPPDQPFLNGPESNCPLDLWKALIPKDSTEFEAVEALEDEKNAETKAAHLVLGFEPLWRRIADRIEIAKAIDEMQTAGNLTTLQAEKLKVALNVP